MTVLAEARPPFPYFGGKQRIADRIVALFPEHGHYVEPYCGGLSVLAAKPRSRMETVNDLDHSVMTFWRVLRDRPDDLARACALTPHSRAELEQARERYDDDLDEVEVARRLWVNLAQGRNGGLRYPGWRTYITASTPSIGLPGYLDAYVDRLAAMAERLHHVSLECRPALRVIENYGASPDVLLYVDPPYLGTTRGSSYNYRHEMRGEDEHRELAEALHACRSTVVLSGYRSPLYDDLYADWHVSTIRAHAGNHTAARSSQRTEVVWSNRPLNGQQVLS